MILELHIEVEVRKAVVVDDSMKTKLELKALKFEIVYHKLIERIVPLDDVVVDGDGFVVDDDDELHHHHWRV